MIRHLGDAAVSVSLIVLSVYFFTASAAWDARTQLAPRAIAGVVLLMALAQAAVSVRGLLQQQRPVGEAAEGSSSTVAVTSTEHVGPTSPEVRRRALTALAAILLFTVGIWLLGFRIGATLMSLVFLRFVARESWKLSTIVAVVVYLIFLILLDRVLAVPFPPGVLAEKAGVAAWDMPLRRLVP